MAAALIGCAQVAGSSTPTVRRCRVAHQRRGELRALHLRHLRRLQQTIMLSPTPRLRRRGVQATSLPLYLQPPASFAATMSGTV